MKEPPDSTQRRWRTRGEIAARLDTMAPDHWPACPRCGNLYPRRPWRRKCECGCPLYPPRLDDRGGRS